MSCCKYTNNAHYCFYLVDTKEALSFDFKIDGIVKKEFEDGFLYNTPLYRKEPDIKENDSLEKITKKFQNAVARTHKDQIKMLDNTFSVSRESDVVILKF